MDLAERCELPSRSPTEKDFSTLYIMAATERLIVAFLAA